MRNRREDAAKRGLRAGFPEDGDSRMGRSLCSAAAFGPLSPSPAARSQGEQSCEKQVPSPEQLPNSPGLGWEALMSGGTIPFGLKQKRFRWGCSKAWVGCWGKVSDYSVGAGWHGGEARAQEEEVG